MKKLSVYAFQNKKEIVFYLMIFLIITSFFWIARQRMNGFFLNSGDTSVADQAIWNSVHGNFFYQSFLGTPTNFREHLNFVQLLYLPFYAIFPSLLTIYAVINIFYGAAAIFLFRHVKERLGFWSGAIFALFFLLQPIAIMQNIDAMHVVAVGAPLLLFSFIFYEQKRYGWWLGFLIATALTSEFVAPTVFLFGLIPILDRRTWKWILPPFIAGAVMYLAAYFYITIGFSKQSSLLEKLNWQKIVDDRIKTRVSRFKDFLRPGLYFLPLFSKYSILLIPTILLALVIINISRLFPGSHLLSLAPPIIVFSILDLLQNRLLKYKKFVLAAMIVGIFISIPVWYKTASISPDERAVSMRKATYLVKDQGSVTSSRIMGIFVNHRKDFYLTDNQNYSDYILLDMSRDEYKKNRKNEYFQKIESSDSYFKVMDENDIGVYIKKQKIAELLGRSEGEVGSLGQQEILAALYSLESNTSPL